MLKVLKYSNDYYIVTYRGVPYIIRYTYSPVFINVLNGKWYVFQNWEPYTSQAIPSSCSDEFEFTTNIKRFLDSNMDRLNKKYNKLKTTAAKIKRFYPNRDTFLVDVVPIENI